MSAMLYLVPTPIGNLSDISERCREVLAQADFIAAEDTRVTLRLLNHLELKKPLVSYYEHALAHGEGILQRIEAGECGRRRVAAQDDAVGVIDVREGEVDRVQLARVDGWQGRAIHHVADHDGAMRRRPGMAEERQQREQRQQAGGEAVHGHSTVVATRAGPPL